MSVPKGNIYRIVLINSDKIAVIKVKVLVTEIDVY